MAPGPAEEAGKALSTVTDAMRSQPLALALILVNLVWVGFFVWFSATLRDRNTKEREYHQLVIERCIDLRKEFGPEQFKRAPAE